MNAQLYVVKPEPSQAVSTVCRVDVNEHGPTSDPLLTPLFTYDWDIRSLDVSPDGRYLVFAGQFDVFYVDLTNPNPLSLWNSRNLAPICRNQTPTSVAVDKDDRIFFGLSYYYKVGNTDKSSGSLLAAKIGRDSSGRPTTLTGCVPVSIDSYTQAQGLAVDPAPLPAESRCCRLYSGQLGNYPMLSWSLIGRDSVQPGQPGPSPTPLALGNWSWDDNGNQYQCAGPRFMNSPTPRLVLPIEDDPNGGCLPYILIGQRSNTGFQLEKKVSLVDVPRVTQAVLVGYRLYAATKNGLYHGEIVSVGGTYSAQFELIESWVRDIDPPLVAAHFP